MSHTHAVRVFLDPSHEELAAQVAQGCAELIAPLGAPADDDAGRAQAREFLSRVGAKGWFGYAIPQAYGGQRERADLRSCALVREGLAAHSSVADLVFALQALGSLPISMAGSEEQRQRWLPKVATGEAMAAFAMTEKGAGSDVSSLATHAVRDGDDYVINGAKIFISNAGLADYYVVFASTDPEARNRGISLFIVEADNPGLRFVRPMIMSAPHPLGEICFEDCRVAASARIGEEGGGFKIGMATLDIVRPTVAAAACGMARRALDEGLKHAMARQQFGKPLSDFQMIQDKLARMAIQLDAARLLVYRAAWEHDTGTARITMPASMAKAFATEAAQRIIDDAIQIVGGAGVMADHPVDQLYRAIRALRIYEGTTEIQHLIIAGQLIKGAS